MSGDLTWFVFALPDESRHLVEGQVPALLAKLGEEVGGRFAASYLDMMDRIAVTNDEASLRGVWEFAVAGEDEYASLPIWYEADPDFQFSLHFSLTAPLQAMISVDDGYFAYDEPIPLARFSRLMQTWSLLYRELRPVYGYGPGSPETSGWQLGLSQPAMVYDCSIFGPALVEKYGRDMLLNLPTWRTETYSDGGMLLQMCPGTLRSNYKSKHIDDYELAAERLGLATERWVWATRNPKEYLEEIRARGNPFHRPPTSTSGPKQE